MCDEEKLPPVGKKPDQRKALCAVLPAAESFHSITSNHISPCCYSHDDILGDERWRGGGEEKRHKEKDTGERGKNKGREGMGRKRSKDEKR